MQLFIEILKLIGVSLLPGAAGLLIYILNTKINCIKNLNKYVKGIIIGIIFTGTTMIGFYYGMSSINVYKFEVKIQGCFAPLLVSPIIASMIFGWIPGLITGVAGGLWRFFAVDLAVRDYLRIPNSLCILLASLIGILISKILLDKNTTKTPKWTYGVVIGLIIECIHLLLTFSIITFKYNDIDVAHEIINRVDWALFLCTTISLSLAFLWLNLYNKEPVRIFAKHTKLHSSIQKRLTITFAIGLFITLVSSSTTSLLKSYSDAASDLFVAGEDVVNEVHEAVDDYGFTNGQILRSIVSNRRIRTNGFIVIVSAKDQYILDPWDSDLNDQENNVKKDQIIGTPNRFDKAIEAKLYFNNNENDTCDKFLNRTVKFKNKDNVELECQSSDLFKTSIYDYNNDRYVKVLAAIIKTKPVKGINEFYVCSILSLDEATDSVVLSIRMSLYFELLVYSIIYILIYRLIRNKVVDNIDSINNSLHRISSGKLNTKVNVREYDEFTSLSNDINSTVNVLKNYIKDANKRIDDELRYAKTIQMNSIPIVFPTSRFFDLHASMITAKQVGGDFYDFFFIDDNHLFFMIADVSGKGIPAAMFMMRAKTLVNALAQTKELTLDQIIDNVNDELNVDNKSVMFVTAFAGILDVSTGKIEYVNAGHTRPLIKTKSGDVSYLQMKTNTVLGIIPRFKYVLETTYLKPGDQILVYTDGVTEAMSKKKKLYGEERLMNLFKNNSFSDARDSIDALNKELQKYQKGIDQADDITILSLIYKPKK